MMTHINDVIIVNEGESFLGSVEVEDGIIKRIIRTTSSSNGEVRGKTFLLPGIIDDHVHFRDPGMTHKATMHTESMAAAAGGVTSVLDMPNVIPQTTTVERWNERMRIARDKMHVNYGFFLGATNDNIGEIQNMPQDCYPGVKLFMGSSTGNMLVDRVEALRDIFRRSPKLIMTHCEDTAIINRNMQEAKQKYGEDPSIDHYPEIRSREACLASSRLAVEMAKESGARLHIAHVTTKEEIELLGENVTGEVCVSHLLYTDEDYRRLGSLIKCNPAIKSKDDREALRKALADGRITCIGTDHAPHLLSEKMGGAAKAVSGMPMVQFSLVSMLQLVDEGVLTIERLVELMCHNPARLFGIRDRGFIREGMKADLTLVSRQSEPYTIQEDGILSLCHWSPRTGDSLNWRVESTWVNGQLVWNGETVNEKVFGEALTFSK